MDCRCSYGFGRTIDLDCEKAVKRVREGLQDRGFSILFQLDVGDLWRSEEGPEGRYVILGACNPRAASRAFSADSNIGLVLPCHLAIYEEGGGQTRIMAADPASFMDLLRRPAAIEMAIEMKEQLEGILEDLN